MADAPIATDFFALCVVRLDERFLLVEEHERRGWYLPGGRVEPGETLLEAAVRETREEAGIAINVESLLRIEHTPKAEGRTRIRAVFVARPVDDSPPKAEADEHTLGARWFTVEELETLTTRGPDVSSYVQQVVRGGPLAPLSLLGYDIDGAVR
ncbi:MAG: NUDIX domain-containing protein [Myxococcota bacterium]